jgi:hypothetical protein
MDINSVVLNSVVKKDVTTESHKAGTENTKRSKMKNMNLNSVVLCETSVYSVVKNKDLTTENHKAGTENTKRSKMKNMNFNSVALCETSVYSVVKKRFNHKEI